MSVGRSCLAITVELVGERQWFSDIEVCIVGPHCVIFSFVRGEYGSVRVHSGFRSTPSLIRQNLDQSRLLEQHLS